MQLMFFTALLALMFQWSDGAKMELELKADDPVLVYQLTGSGFQDSEELFYISYSSGEILTAVINVSPSGDFLKLLLPEVMGVAQGKGIISIKRRTLEETGRIDYEWKSPPMPSDPLPIRQDFT